MYRVDWVPELDLDFLRNAFIKKHGDLFGGYLYDGKNMIYLTHELADNEKKFDCESREGKHYEMTVKKVGAIHATSDKISQIHNLILRLTMKGLGMERVGHNFYDPKAKVRTDFIFADF